MSTTAFYEGQGIYEGWRDERGTHVVFKHAGKKAKLNPRLDLFNHSPTGLEWGYGGSGPAQCALAILANHLGDDERAVALHQPFKWLIVARLSREGWLLTTEEVSRAIQQLESERARA